MVTYWHNNLHIGNIYEKIINMLYNQVIDHKKYTNILLQTHIKYAHKYSYQCIYKYKKVAELIIHRIDTEKNLR